MADVENSNKTEVVSLILLGALAIVPPLFGTAFTRYDWLKSSILLIITGLGAFFWALSIFRGKQTEWKNAKAGALILGFGLFSLLSLIWAPNVGFGLEHAAIWFMFSILSFLFATHKTKVLSDYGPAAISIGVIVSSLLCFADRLGMTVFSKIWDAPGATGPFDGADQAGTYFFLATSVLLLSRKTDEKSWRNILVIMGTLLGALVFGTIGSMSIIHFALLAAVIISHYLTNKRKEPVVVSAVVILNIAIGFAFFPRPDANATISNKLPVMFSTPSISKSSKIQNANFDINRIADAEMGPLFSKLTGDLFSRDFSSILVGEGAGSWWLGQKPDFPKAEFQYYSIHRNSPGLVIFELGMLGILFLIGFVATLLFSKTKDQKFRHLAIPIFLMFVLAGLFSTLASVLLILACAVGMYSGDEEEKAIFTFNSANNRGLSIIMAIAILVGGLALIEQGAFSGIARFKESRGDLLMLRKKYTDAAKAYERAYSFSKFEPSVAYNYALALKLIGHTKIAVEPANMAISIKPHDARYLYLRSELYLSKRDLRDIENKENFNHLTNAAEVTEKAIENFPNYVDAINSLVRIQDLQGRQATANLTLLKLVELDPPAKIKRQAHWDLAESFTILGNPKRSLEHYQKALIGESNSRKKQTLSLRISQIETKAEVERLEREGKDIPEKLRHKLKHDDHSGHNH